MRAIQRLGFASGGVLHTKGLAASESGFFLKSGKLAPLRGDGELASWRKSGFGEGR
jgi:hypothetical protein